MKFRKLYKKYGMENKTKQFPLPIFTNTFSLYSIV
jgi:hypothetical protein